METLDKILVDAGYSQSETQTQVFETLLGGRKFRKEVKVANDTIYWFMPKIGKTKRLNLFVQLFESAGSQSNWAIYTLNGSYRMFLHSTHYDLLSIEFEKVTGLVNIRLKDENEGEFLLKEVKIQ